MLAKSATKIGLAKIDTDVLHKTLYLASNIITMELCITEAFENVPKSIPESSVVRLGCMLMDMTSKCHSNHAPLPSWWVQLFSVCSELSCLMNFDQSQS